MTCAIVKLKNAPARAQQAIIPGGENRSGKLNTALTSAPATNPSCTLIVSHAASRSERSHASFNAGATALAENHSAIASSSTTASKPSCSQRDWCGGSNRVSLKPKDQNLKPHRVKSLDLRL